MTPLARGASSAPDRPLLTVAAPVSVTSPREAAAAFADLLDAGGAAAESSPTPAVREVVWQSWRRSLAAGLGTTPGAGGCWSATEVTERLAAHPLGSVVPLLSRLLVDDLAADGMIVLLTDAAGRVLWLDGSRGMRSRGERVGLGPGADVSESVAGTNAPALALVTGRCAQVHRFEHYAEPIRAFSCSAAPVVDPVTGRLLGAIDVTGGDHAATPAVLALVRVAVAAVGSELRWTRVGRRRAAASPAGGRGGAHLRVLGRERGVLSVRGQHVELSRRHTELLLTLVMAAAAGEGRTADELAQECWDDDVPTVTVRAELTRLRRIVGEGLLGSRPYRLRQPVHTDVADILPLLRRGSHRQALDAYPGPLLPRSSAPAVVALRNLTHRQLREALIAHGSVDLLERFATQHHADDADLWAAVVQRLPAGSARQTLARAHLAALDARLR